MPIPSRRGIDPQPFSYFADRVSALHDLRHSVLLKLIRKPNSLTHIRLTLVPKLPSKASTNLGAPHPKGPPKLQRPDPWHDLWFCKPTQELCHAVDLVIMFAVGKQRDLALELRDPRCIFWHCNLTAFNEVRDREQTRSLVFFRYAPCGANRPVIRFACFGRGVPALYYPVPSSGYQLLIIGPELSDVSAYGSK
jgi:hypothetical protein